MADKPSIPKGTRDFSPAEMAWRNYIFDTIKKVFRKYGFLPIETPAMENLSTLLGKYGDEGDKLLFKVLNSGDFLSGVTDEGLLSRDTGKLAAKLCEKGLRYDLTVPFARYVVQYRNDITFPFRRYQMQNVWRADRPQKGRYREFYQCDVDVIGSNSLLNEVEIIQIIDDVFSTKNLNTKVLIKINNRKILSGIAEVIGAGDKITDITTAIDKSDKIGIEKVNEELLQKGVSPEAVSKLHPIMNLTGSFVDKISELKALLNSSVTGLAGIEETEKIFGYLKELNIASPLELDITLARGLNYYTGAIIEVKSTEEEIGSICGGGRYDNLTGIFGLKDVSGVGVSFGADRIYDVLARLNRYPSGTSSSAKILFVNFGEKEEKYCLPLIEKIRGADISAELYPDQVKMKKQFDYANSKGIPFVAIIGESEMTGQYITLKDMGSGEQEKINTDGIIRKFAR